MRACTIPLLVLALVAMGCDRAEERAAGSTLEDITGSGWRLVSLRGSGAADPLTPAADHVPTLAFGEEPAGPEGFHLLTGSGGCNVMGGAYRVPGPGRLDTRDLVSTERACLASEVMGTERAYFEALASAREFELRGETLEIRSAEAILTFRAAGDAP